MLRLKRSDWVDFGQYKAPTLYLCLLQDWAKSQKSTSLPRLEGRLLIPDGHLMFSRRDWETIVAATKKAFAEKDEEFFAELFEECRESSDAVLRMSERLRMNPKVSVEVLQEYMDTFNRMEYPWLFLCPLGYAVQEIVEKTASDPPSFFVPFQPTLLMQQRQKMLALKEGLLRVGVLSLEPNEISKRYPELYSALQEHVREYEWIGMMHWWGSPFSLEKLLVQMRSAKKEETVSFGKLSEEAEWVRQKTRRIAYWRQYLAEVCAVASYNASKCLEQCSQKMGLSYAQAMWLTPTEFLTGLQGKTVPSVAILQERKRGYCLLPEGEPSVVTGMKLEEIRELVLDVVPEGNVLKGLAASSGKAHGIACVILSPDDLRKMKQGQIMVCNETTPDYLSAAQKAAAIVTDIGGLGSHASILSRELGVPCIVGTKFATRKIKDGDVVEVDGDKQTVTLK
ncbi:hypothetical protein HZC09_05085 [Candidatus Micrarchaeota archaeon]|nr:hypothetical protein [Candidatus Micrarchaeota archaeon]